MSEGRVRSTDPLLPAAPALHDGVFGGIGVSPGGIVTLPDGQVRAVMRVGAVNPGALSDGARNKLALDLAALVSALAPGQRMQVLVESRPLRMGELLPDILAPLIPRARRQARLAHFVADYRDWLSSELARTHLPDLRFYFMLAPPPPRRVPGRPAERAGREQLLRQLEQGLDDLSSHLKAMELPHAPLGGEGVLELHTHQAKKLSNNKLNSQATLAAGLMV